jgi:hypothetical protein
MTFKRNLQSLTVLLLVLGRSACLFFGQMRVHHATLLPETLVVHICSIVQDFERKSITFLSTSTISPRRPSKKDSFHNLFLSLTKGSPRILLTQQPQQDFLFPEGGDGWRKTLKMFPVKILSPIREFTSVSLSDLSG